MKELLKTTQAYRLLKRECEENTSSHAYLLVFNDGKNLRLALKEFAKIFFGADDNEWLEGKEKQEKERIARLIDEDNYSDCILFPEEGKKLMVEDAERVLEESVLTPLEGEKKVFLLGDFAEANMQTQNKLLKVLEGSSQDFLRVILQSFYPSLEVCCGVVQILIWNANFPAKNGAGQLGAKFLFRVFFTPERMSHITIQTILMTSPMR